MGLSAPLIGIGYPLEWPEFNTHGWEALKRLDVDPEPPAGLNIRTVHLPNFNSVVFLSQFYKVK